MLSFSSATTFSDILLISLLCLRYILNLSYHEINIKATIKEAKITIPSTDAISRGKATAAISSSFDFIEFSLASILSSTPSNIVSAIELRFCLFAPGPNSIESKPLSEELTFILLPVSAESFLLSSDRSCALAPEIGNETIVMTPNTIMTAIKRPLVVLKLLNFFPLDTAAEKDG